MVKATTGSTTLMTQDETPTSEQLMPGKMLKQARKARGMEKEEIAKQLHLTVATITAIEEDNYRNMAAPVYAKGYLKQYAKFLDAPSDLILEAFDKNVKVKSKVLEEMPSYAKKKKMTAKHPVIRFFTYGIIILLFILVGMWWNAHENTGSSTNKAPKSKKEKNSQVKNSTTFSYSSPSSPMPLKNKTDTGSPLKNSPPNFKERKEEKPLKTENSSSSNHLLFDLYTDH
jgi:cytoskeletal protein RodZ